MHLCAHMCMCTRVYTCVCLCVCAHLGGTVWGNENLAVMQLSGIFTEQGVSCSGVPSAPSADSEFLSRPTSFHLAHASIHTQVQKPALLETKLKPRGF